MKKNIRINLFGSLYNIDEDAYELLDKYLLNMKQYFSHRDGGEEIAGDIEARVAELLDELKTEGREAVTIEDVQSIIGRIGNPEQMDCETDGAGAASDGAVPPPPPEFQGGTRTRKLYRDPEDKLLGGVLAGICHYFGGSDPLPWRIIFFILCFMSWSSLAVIYLVLWALLPEARTAEERLMMQGKPVNTSTLNEEIMRGYQQTKNFISNPSVQSQARGCLGTLLRVIVFFICAMAALFLAGLLMVVVICIGVVIMVGFAGMGEHSYIFHDGSFSAFLMEAPTLRWWLLALGCSTLAVIVIPLYALVRRLFTKRGASPAPLSATSRTVLIVVWLMMLALAVTSAAMSVGIADRVSERIDEREDIRIREENTRDGVFLYPHSWRYLDERGWTLPLYEHGNYSLVTGFDDPGQEGERFSSLDCLDISQMPGTGKLRFRLEKTLEVQPGHYRFVAFVNPDGQGTAFFAAMDDDVLMRQDVNPRAAGLPSAADDSLVVEVLGHDKVTTTDSVLQEGGWRAVAFDFDVPRAGTLRFGFSNESEYAHNPWTSTRFIMCYDRIMRRD